MAPFVRSIKETRLPNTVLDTAFNGIGRSIVEDLPGPFLIKDREGRLILVNRAVEQFFGISREDILGKTNKDFFSGHVLEQIEQSDSYVLNTGETVCVEESTSNQDGQLRFYSIMKSPMWDGEEIVGVIVHAHDITDFQASHAALRHALKAANASAWDWAIGGDFNVSDSYRELYGLDPDLTLSFQSWIGHVVDEDRDRVQNRLNDAFRLRAPEYYDEFRIKHPERGPIWIAEQGSISYDEHGNAHRMTGISFEVTAKKQVEQDLEKALAKATKAERTKSRFLAAASHDLRQPLQAALFQAAELSAHLAEGGSEKFRRLEESLNILGDLLDGLLDISGLEPERVAPNFESVCLDTVFDRVRAGLANAARQKNLIFRACHSGIWVTSDAMLLERMLFNLADNAVKYTDKGHVEIAATPDCDRIVISVSDTGIGIPAGHEEDIWTEFRQLGNPARDRRRGIGLGLSIVQRLAAILGHPVTLESRPGEGATFAVAVPVGTPPAPKEEPPRMVAQALSGTVLVVEDDPMVLAALSAVLRERQLVTLEVGGLREALEMLAEVEAAPDFIVSDYRLPEASGVAVIDRVRSVFQKDIPALLLTGDVTRATVTRASKKGIRVLTKPVAPDLLFDALTELWPATSE